MSQRIDQFLAGINSIRHENAKQVLATTYTENVIFVDPVKTIHGLDDLTHYFKDLYKHVNKCHFELNDHISSQDNHSLQWVMHLKHQKISKSQEIQIDGASFLRFDGDKVNYHRDYYDLGAMVYEHVPILGSVIKKVRNAI